MSVATTEHPAALESVFRPLLAPTASSPSPFQRRRRLLSLSRKESQRVEVKKKPSQTPVLQLHRATSDAAHKDNNVKRKLGTAASPAPPRDDVSGKSDRTNEDGGCNGNGGGGGGPDLAVRLTVVGGRQVGKSALAVRYLTRRYIGEYQSFSDLCYRQQLVLDGQPVEVEIVDVSHRKEVCLHLPLSRIRRSDAVVVLYSIVDRKSFEAARMALAKIGEEKQTMLDIQVDAESERAAEAEVSGVGSALVKASRLPLVTLLGNKTDLAHLREVDAAEGRDLSRRHDAFAFHEVSVADQPSATVDVMNSMVAEIWKEKMEAYASSLVFKPPFHPLFDSVSPNSKSARDTPPPFRDGSPNNGKVDGGISASKKVSSSVFSVSKVFSNLLLNRGSSPLPTRSHSTGSSTSASSIKKVFKKRSV